MSCYMLFIREEGIVDPEAMAQYQAGNGASPPPPELKPLVVYGAMEAFEGEAPDGVVILEFPDRQSARDWYLSDEYQQRAKLRLKGAPSYRCILVDGL